MQDASSSEEDSSEEESSADEHAVAGHLLRGAAAGKAMLPSKLPVPAGNVALHASSMHGQTVHAVPQKQLRCTKPAQEESEESDSSEDEESSGTEAEEASKDEQSSDGESSEDSSSSSEEEGEERGRVVLEVGKAVGGQSANSTKPTPPGGVHRSSEQRGSAGMGRGQAELHSSVYEGAHRTGKKLIFSDAWEQHEGVAHMPLTVHGYSSMFMLLSVSVQHHYCP